MKVFHSKSSRARIKHRRRMLKLQRDKKHIIAHSREVQAKLVERRTKLREIASQEYNEALYNDLVRRGREHDLSYTQLLISRCASLEARKKKTA